MSTPIQINGSPDRWPHWQSLLLLSAGTVLPLSLFAYLAHEVFQESGFFWDQVILQWYVHHRTPALTQAAKLLEVLGGLGVLPIVVLGVVLLLYRINARIHGWFLISSMVGALTLNLIIKGVFHRPRPDELVSVLRESGFSFPSGHAMTNAAFAAALILIFWRSGRGRPVTILAVIWMLLIGLSRNYLGVHYPSDVLAAFSAGMAWVNGLFLLMGHHWPELRGAPGTSPVAPTLPLAPIHTTETGGPE